MRTLIYGGTIVNEGQQKPGSIVIEGDRIAEIIFSEEKPRGIFDKEVDATGHYVLPGVIDSHVHFREPGLTHKADIATESRAAALGGVTSYFDMPNTIPQTTTREALDEKRRLAREKSAVNYNFFPGATNDNIEELRLMDRTRIPGVKIFMGSSTGNMLVDNEAALDRLFSFAGAEDLQLMAHCEDTATINANMERYCRELATDDPPVGCHPLIRSHEACEKSTRLGVAMAEKHGCRFHVAHISTEREIALVGAAKKKMRPDCPLPMITAEATVAHLLFQEEDYKILGTRIKCNPAVKTAADMNALRRALCCAIQTVGTDHAPHTLEEKEGGAKKAVSGMPMVQFSLPAMLSLASESEGRLALTDVAQLMSHNPAMLFRVADRGFLRKGFKADIAIVKEEEWIVRQEDVVSRCGWSPIEGRRLQWRVSHTFCNGHHLNNLGTLDPAYRGEEIRFQ